MAVENTASEGESSWLKRLGVAVFGDEGTFVFSPNTEVGIAAGREAYGDQVDEEDPKPSGAAAGDAAGAGVGDAAATIDDDDACTSAGDVAAIVDAVVGTATSAIDDGGDTVGTAGEGDITPRA